jgi:hypothetical protein
MTLAFEAAAKVARHPFKAFVRGPLPVFSAISDDVVPPSIVGMHIRFKEASYVKLWPDAVHFWQVVNAFLLIYDEPHEAIGTP